MSPIPPATSPSPDFTAFAKALAGQYELDCEIGRGGMGIVYLARDIQLDRRVAIKTLPAHLADDPLVRERFVREARTAGGLSHQHIVPIHRADELGGRVFFVMGYVDGESMAQRVRDRGRLDAREVLRELTDVADALGYAHGRGVIHRDVKAENILIERASGRALVTDFGIARLGEAAPLTATGQVLGTVYYLSPEQVSGNAVDARSDIYSLGVVGFFALAGRFPFNAELASAVLVAHVNKTPPPLHTLAPETPRSLADIIDRCLTKDPADRFQSCGELMGALTAIADEVQRDVAGRESRAAIRAPALVSDTEAQAILGRAADLQAMTGVTPRPPAVFGERDDQRDAARTSGHRPGDLRDAAVEAGIPAKYVDHAMYEHGLGAGPPALTVSDNTNSGNVFIGSPTRLEFEVTVEGEMPENDFGLLVEVIRQSTGESGQISTVGRSFAWQSHPAKGNVHVSVLPRAGRTRIRVSEGLNAAATAFFVGMLAVPEMISTIAWIGIAAKMHEPLFGLLGWLGTTTLAYVGSRGFFGMYNRGKTRQLRALAERLGAQARESIDYATPKLPPADRPRLHG